MELKLHRHGIQTTLASVFGAMLIATPLVGDSALAERHCDGKSFLVPPVDGADGDRDGCDGMAWWEEKHPVCIAGQLLLLFAGITLATYDWQLDPEPEKLLFGGQLVVLWFCCAIFLQRLLA
ncbi:MAG: hypothetical protein ACLR6J_04865 [Parabacteroides merdae]